MKQSRNIKREPQFSSEAFAQLQDWIKVDRKVASKIFDLIEECGRTPHEGKGHPEKLKNIDDYWSRHITHGDRLVYKVDDETVYIASCKGHYGDK